MPAGKNQMKNIFPLTFNALAKKKASHSTKWPKIIKISSIIKFDSDGVNLITYTQIRKTEKMSVRTLAFFVHPIQLKL